MEEMKESEDANYRDVHRALADLAARRGMGPEELAKMEMAYREGTGEFLRSNLLAVPLLDRDEFWASLRSRPKPTTERNASGHSRCRFSLGAPTWSPDSS